MNRGMKQYMPYASLSEQGEFVRQMLYEKNKHKAPLLSLDQIEEINQALQQITNKKKVALCYFLDGYFYNFSGYIQRIESIEGYLQTANGQKIQFTSLIEIHLL